MKIEGIQIPVYFPMGFHRIERSSDLSVRRNGYGGIGVNEKDLVILEQYGLGIKSARRGRGSFLCETDRGLVQVTEFSGSKERLFFQNRVLHFLKEQGWRTDVILENLDGEIVSLDRYENGYVVKEWFRGRECNTKSWEDIQASVRCLARLHQVLRLPPKETAKEEQEALAASLERDQSPEVRKDMEYCGEPLEEELRRHTRELRKVRNFIRARKRKEPFELRFLQVYDAFADQAGKAQERLQSSGGEALHRQCIQERRVSHGDYSQHNILFDSEGEVPVNFARCCFDTQIVDFYYFFRKIMEKQNWNQKMGMEMIQAYQSVRPLGNAEFENLCIRLAYPEKFWKLANHYFNSGKAWIPEKSLQKLEALVSQEKKREDFVKILH